MLLFILCKRLTDVPLPTAKVKNNIHEIVNILIMKIVITVLHQCALRYTLFSHFNILKPVYVT